MKVVLVRERVDEEESVAWMADPFPDVCVRYSNVHPSMVLVIEREEEEGEEVEGEEEEEGEMDRMDESIVTGIGCEEEVKVRERRERCPSV